MVNPPSVSGRGRPWLHVSDGEGRKVKPEHVKGFEFVVPPDGERATLQDHQHYASGKAFGFDHKKFAFDSAVATAYTNSAERGLIVERADNYRKHDALRDNIATLRNMLTAHYFDRELSAREQKAIAKALRNMGARLGRALRDNDKIDGPSNRATGAVAMYEYLQSHNKPRLRDRPLIVGWLIGKTGNKWLAEYFGIGLELPPIEETPFRNEAREAARLYGGRTRKAIIEQLAGEAASLHGQAAGLDDISRLPKQPREDAVVEARKILDNLRIFHSNQAKDGKRKPEPDRRLQESDLLLQLMERYREVLALAAHNDLSIASHASMQQAKLAFASLSDMLDSEASLLKTRPKMLDYEGRDEALRKIESAISYAEDRIGRPRAAGMLPPGQAAAATQAVSRDHGLAAARLAAAPPQAVEYVNEVDIRKKKEQPAPKLETEPPALTRI